MYFFQIIRTEQLSSNMQIIALEACFLMLQLLLFQKQIKQGSSVESQLTNLDSNLVEITVPYFNPTLCFVIQMSVTSVHLKQQAFEK